jgi:hypothetical protein
VGCNLECAQIVGARIAVKNLSPLLGTAVGHECPRCHKAIDIPLGDICADCKAAIKLRARKISRYVAIGTTIPFAAYVYLRLPDDPTLRMVGLSSVVAWYIITGLVTKRILMEALK